MSVDCDRNSIDGLTWTEEADKRNQEQLRFRRSIPRDGKGSDLEAPVSPALESLIVR